MIPLSKNKDINLSIGGQIRPRVERYSNRYWSDNSDETILGNHSIQVDSHTEINIQAGDKPCYILLLQGKPINEPIAQHGLFVMYTKEEIKQAFSEYQRTHFGGWSWPNNNLVHNKNEEGFALHANGKREVR